MVAISSSKGRVAKGAERNTPKRTTLLDKVVLLEDIAVEFLVGWRWLKL